MGILGKIAKGLDIVSPIVDHFQNKKAQSHAKNMATRQIQYAVADAKAAGVHPLFALGGGSSVSPQWGIGSPTASAMAGAVSRVARQSDSESRAKAAAGFDQQMQRAQLRALGASASRDEAAASLDLAQRAQLLSKSNHTPIMRGAASDFFQGDTANLLFPKTSIISSRPNDAAVREGPKEPGMREVQGPYGPQLIPNSEVMESGELPGAYFMLQQIIKDALHKGSTWWSKKSRNHPRRKR